MRPLVVLLIAFLAGCDWVEKVYTFRQDEQPVGTITIRVKVGDDQRLVILEEFEEAGQKKSTFIRDYFAKCHYFDESNWNCEGAPGNERVVMDRGTLTHFYWAQVRNYKRTYRLSLLN